MKPSITRRPTQVLAFLRKETVDVLRQPRLLLTLVIGPFLIMAIFGLGYRDTPKPMRTMFVAPEGSPFLDNVDNYAKDIGSYISYSGSTSDPEVARQKLLDGKIDLVVTFPADPLQTVLSGDQATISITHTRLDPIEQTAINFASQLGIDRVNGQILSKVVSGAQDVAKPLGDLVTSASSTLGRLESSATSGDQTGATKAATDLQNLTAQLVVAARTSTALTDQLSQQDGQLQVGAEQQTATSTVDQLQALVDDLQADPSGSASALTPQIRDQLGAISSDYREFTAVNPLVLVEPFAGEIELAAPKVDKVTDWYAPAAIVLMLQQFGVAFGALSFVRERQLGIVDVYRVAPVNATETIIGKYLAYLVIGGAVAAALTALIVGVLDVPIASSIGQVALGLGLSLFASIGLGFLVSLISRTDAQAVQYTMIILLASLFFSGFFLSVGHMEGLARFIGWLLPVTYGMELLRDAMLRGGHLSPGPVIGLAVYGIVAFALALYGTRRRMTPAAA